MIVLDASIAVKWFRADEPDRERALRVLDRVGAEPEQFAVPELFFNEVLAVLTRMTGIDDEELGLAIASVEELGLERVGNGHDLLQLAARRARALGISGYDAIYLATAELLDGTWLTADERAQRKVRDKRRVTLLAELH